MGTSCLRALVLVMVGCSLGASAAGAENFWRPAAPVDLAEVRREISEAAKTDEALLRQPVVLTYRAALYLATGSLYTETHGREQKVSVTFGPGEGPYSSGTVTVEFLGYLDDSLLGERFNFHLAVGKDRFWQLLKAERAAYGRGDHR